MEAQNICSKYKKYVSVTCSFDSTGYLHPMMISLDKGKDFLIEEVIAFRPSKDVGAPYNGDCYTVRIEGQAKHLFFEHTDPNLRSLVGRWFVECISHNI